MEVRTTARKGGPVGTSEDRNLQEDAHDIHLSIHSPELSRHLSQVHNIFKDKINMLEVVLHVLLYS